MPFMRCPQTGAQQYSRVLTDGRRPAGGKRIVAAALTTVLGFLLLPATAFAEGDAAMVTDSRGTTSHATFADAWNDAVEHSTATNHVTVKLLKDVTAALALDSSVGTSFGTGIGFGAKGYILVPQNKNITLDMNGKKLDRGLKEKAAVENGNVITVSEGSELKITSSANANGQITGGRNSTSF